MRPSIPSRGRDPDELMRELDRLRDRDTDWKRGRVFSLVYHAGEAHEQLLLRAHARFASANLLNPMAFQSLKRLEADVVQMAASLFHGPEGAVGCMTSGGTESILLAVQAYRERARRERRGGRSPEIVVPDTVHPAFDKAAHYFGVKLVRVSSGDDHRASVRAMRRRIGRRTIAIVGSAPQYPHGLVDPIAELGDLAEREGLPLHVDACVGGFMLPFVEKLGRAVPTWDFRVPGVTSISADLHKYGYAAKGASVLLWRSMDDMRHQFFVSTGWAGGAYASPSLPGTRPGGPIAAAWTALQAMGESGYLELTRKALEAADRLRAGVAQIPELCVVGDSTATLLAWGARDRAVDVFSVADRLEARGWFLDRQSRPPSVHLTVTANHLPIVDAYLADLRAAVAEVKADPSLAKSGTAPMYGMMAKVPVRGLVDSSVRKVMEAMYAPGVVVPDVTSASEQDGLVGRLLARHGDKVNAVLDRIDSVREVVRSRRRKKERS